MKNLNNGSICKTLGFYEINDKGSSVYKVTTADETLINESNVISLANNLMATLIYEDNMNIKQFGAYGDDTNDDTNTFKSCFENIPSGTVMYLNGDEVYKITDSIIVNNNVNIIGNNANIKIYEDGITLFNINNDNISVKDLIIDGSETTQDKFAVTDISTLNIITAFDITSELIDLNNITVSNIYGNAFHSQSVKNFKAENITINNVGGHWYENNSNDSFGDTFYFRNLPNNAIIDINNCNIDMKYKNTTYSRAGIVCEVNTNDNANYNTYINLNNSSIVHADRCVHIENQTRQVYLDTKNTHLYGNCWVFTYNSPYTIIESYNNIYDTYEENYNGSKGIKYAVIHDKKSIYNLQNHNRSFISDTKSALIEECTINNIINTIFNTAQNVVLKKCTLNISGSHYLSYYYSPTLEECTFNSANYIAEQTSGNVLITKNCIFNKYMPNCKGGGNILNTDSSSHVPNYANNGAGITVYLDGALLSIEKSFFVFPYDMEFLDKYYTNVNLSDNTPVSMIQNRLTTPGEKYVLVMIGTNSASASDRIKTGFDYCVITCNSDGSLTASASTKVGNYSAGFNLTIDTTNLTVTKSGGYATKYQSILIPYHLASYIGLIN